MRRKIINFLEDNGFRILISICATFLARTLTKLNIKIFHDEFWIIRVSDSFLIRKKKFDLYLPDIHEIRFRHKEFLREPVDHWLSFYKPQLGDIILDIGAGSGVDAIILSELVGLEGKVFSLEAHPTTFRRLAKTCKWNQLKNVVPVHLAVWSERGHLEVSDLDLDVANTVRTNQVISQKEIVKAIDLDSFIEEMGIERIDFLKMNIEGAERMAIKGMYRAISITRNIAIACHDFLSKDGSGDFVSRQEVLQFLHDNNFTVFQRPNDRRPYVRDHIYGVRN